MGYCARSSTPIIVFLVLFLVVPTVLLALSGELPTLWLLKLLLLKLMLYMRPAPPYAYEIVRA